MDVLSDVMASVRAGRPGAGRVEWHAPWGQNLPGATGTAGFLVVSHGSCWLIPETGGPMPLGVGDVLFFPHGDGCSIADSPTTPLTDWDHPEQSAWFHSTSLGHPGDEPTAVTLCGGYRLDPSWGHPLLRDLPTLVHVAASHRHPELRATVETLSAELDEPRPGTDTAIPALLDMLLLYILRAWFEDQPEQGRGTAGWTAALADPTIRTALNAIHQHPGHPWTVQALADEAHVSRAAFSRRFSALIGQAPLTYVTWWRLSLAAQALGSSGAPIREIAAHVGYTSEFAFANAFKRRYGIPPGQYRRGRPAAPHAGMSSSNSPTGSARRTQNSLPSGSASTVKSSSPV